MRTIFALLPLSLLCCLLPTAGHASSSYLPHSKPQKVSIRFVARSSGFRLGMSGGNQDVYLVLLSAQKGKTPVLAKLVDEYLYCQDEVPQTVLRSSKPDRLAVQRWTLCDAPLQHAPTLESYLTAVIAQHASSSGQPSGNLPCYKLDHQDIGRLAE